MTENIYCYVDETGQDTEGRLFIVSVVIVASQRAVLVAELEKIERISGKGTVKWIHTRPDVRFAYIEKILSSQKFIGTIFFSVYSDTKSYMSLTVTSTARAILAMANKDTVATVYVDGMPKTHAYKFGSSLRQLNIKTRKVLGIRREESNALLRLVDAYCGFIRAALSEEKRNLAGLLKKGLSSGHMKKV